MAYKVFISHSNIDNWVAEQIQNHIHRLGGETFFDQSDVEVGDDYMEIISKEITASQEFLVLLTPWAVRSNMVTVETTAAHAQRKRIILVLYNVSREMALTNSIFETVISAFSYIEVNNLGKYFEQLTRRIQNRP